MPRHKLGSLLTQAMIRNLRIRLTILYTLAIAVVMAAFSIALYIALATNTDQTLEVPEKLTRSAEQAVIDAQLARARWALLAINASGWVLGAGASYLLAGRTLQPLEQAMARQRQFTAHASHELRTPLTVMKGEIGVTLARERKAEEYCETLSRVDEEVTRLENMSRDLLTLARLEADALPLHPRSRNVREALEEVTADFRMEAQSKEADLWAEAPADIEASLDWARIDQLLSNLLRNAVRHVSTKGRIVVSAESRGAV